MAKNTTHIPRPREAVLAVLRDPDCYPKWVVGASDVKDRSATFPEPGSWFTYAIKVGPMTLTDKTIVEAFEDGKVVLRARARPIGAARIELHLRERDGGTEVEMREYASHGVAKTLWNPLFDKATHARNTEGLRRLKDLVESTSAAGETAHEAGRTR